MCRQVCVCVLLFLLGSVNTCHIKAWLYNLKKAASVINSSIQCVYMELSKGQCDFAAYLIASDLQPSALGLITFPLLIYTCAYISTLLNRHRWKKKPHFSPHPETVIEPNTNPLTSIVYITVWPQHSGSQTVLVYSKFDFSSPTCSRSPNKNLNKNTFLIYWTNTK